MLSAPRSRAEEQGTLREDDARQLEEDEDQSSSVFGSRYEEIRTSALSALRLARSFSLADI
jgi:hypothetical protein